MGLAPVAGGLVTTTIETKMAQDPEQGFRTLELQDLLEISQIVAMATAEALFQTFLQGENLRGSFYRPQPLAGDRHSR